MTRLLVFTTGATNRLETTGTSKSMNKVLYDLRDALRTFFGASNIVVGTVNESSTFFSLASIRQQTGPERKGDRR